MSAKLGFAILSHNYPEQLLRLVTTLTAIFDAPPIACHHDFTQCSLDIKSFPNNVKFVTPHIETKWGHISVPLAALKALAQLRSQAPADWFVLLSGSDYPVRSAEEIIGDLENSDYDVFLDHREIQFAPIPSCHSDQHGFGRPDWIRKAAKRYYSYNYWLPVPSRQRLYSGHFPFRKRPAVVRNPTIVRILNKVRRPLRIYGGDFWFQANHKAIDSLLNAALDPLIRYFYKRKNPDEALFHTALCNRADLKISPDHKRYSDWRGDEAHPKWLELSHISLIRVSRAHFARKFRPDGVLQEYVDHNILGL